MRLLLPPAPGKRGNHFVTPAGNAIAYTIQPVLSIFLCQPWNVFARIEIHPFSAERLSGSRQRGQVFIQAGRVWGVTQELIFSPVPSNSRRSTNVLFLHSMKKINRKWHSLPSDGAKCCDLLFLLVLCYCFRGPFQTLNGFVETTMLRGIVQPAKNIQFWPRLNWARAGGNMWLTVQIYIHI